MVFAVVGCGVSGGSGGVGSSEPSPYLPLPGYGVEEFNGYQCSLVPLSLCVISHQESYSALFCNIPGMVHGSHRGSHTALRRVLM